MEEIRIVEVIADGIAAPKGDGTRGSSLYAVPFRLSRIPSPFWAKAFVRTWNSPPQYTTMHRPGIARVEGDRIILDGTTIEEVERTHKATLELCVCEANRIEAEEMLRKTRAEEDEQARSDAFVRGIKKKAKDIKFD